MILVINGKLHSVLLSHFSLLVVDETHALDVLAEWMQRGLVPVKATLFDSQQKKELPVYLFTDQDLIVKFKALQLQWQQALKHPLWPARRWINSVKLIPFAGASPTTRSRSIYCKQV